MRGTRVKKLRKEAFLFWVDQRNFHELGRMSFTSFFRKVKKEWSKK